MAPTSLRFGILGAARIAPKALIQPIAKLPGVVVSAVAARDRTRADAFATEHGIELALPAYRHVIESDEVDVVYNPLPMSLHAEWTIAALRAGKHVLCEKPFSSNAAEAVEMVHVAAEEGRILGEAFHYRYHPLFERVVQEVRSGRIGAIERVEAVFHTEIAKPDLRWDYGTSGGSLMDLGCYPLSWARQVMGQEPTIVSAVAVEGPDKIDASINAEMSFASGATASISSAMDRPFEVGLKIVGALGEIVVQNPLAPRPETICRFVLPAARPQGRWKPGTPTSTWCERLLNIRFTAHHFPPRGKTRSPIWPLSTPSIRLPACRFAASEQERSRFYPRVGSCFAVRLPRLRN